MIARVWHGKTEVSKFEEYSTFLKKRAIPDYTKTEGFIGLHFLRKITESQAHFYCITFWESACKISAFAGKDIQKAKYYEEDKNFLLEFEDEVEHFEVFATKI